MVQLQLVEDGHVAYVEASAVTGIRSWGAAKSDSLVERRGMPDLYVKGTPDEVHAKLFPPEPAMGFSTTERNEAMLQVLEWVADENVPANASPSARLVTLARKALGLEET